MHLTTVPGGYLVHTRRTNNQMADHKTTDRERAIIDAYRAGEKVTAIQQRLGVGRSMLYHILHRAGVKPARSRRQVDAASGDARLAGLAELIAHQDQLIVELQDQVKKLERENAALKRKLQRVS